jgi:hypothetical protein
VSKLHSLVISDDEQDDDEKAEDADEDGRQDKEAQSE